MANKFLYFNSDNELTYDRWDIIAELITVNNFKLGVEIGVGWGETFKNIVQMCPNIEWIGIDAFDNTIKTEWKDYRYNPSPRNAWDEWDFKKWEPELKNWVKNKNNAVIMKELGDEAAKWFSNDSIDIIFIDEDNGYKSITRNVKAWKSKMSPRGLFCGYYYNSNRKEETKAALNEHFHKYSVLLDDFWVARVTHLKDRL